MRAIVHDDYGAAEVLQVREIPTPVAASGQVLLRAAGVDMTLWHGMTGLPLLAPRTRASAATQSGARWRGRRDR